MKCAKGNGDISSGFLVGRGLQTSITTARIGSDSLLLHLTLSSYLKKQFYMQKNKIKLVSNASL